VTEARARVRVRGRVQGVFFRVETRDRARSLGLAGWVRNRPDGTVEAVFEGESERVQSMVGWCGRGPSGASVDGVDVEWEEPAGERKFTVV
jgi:acylphosphatase